MCTTILQRKMSKILYCHNRFHFSKSQIIKNPATSIIPNWIRLFSTIQTQEQNQSLPLNAVSDLYRQFSDEWVHATERAKEDLVHKVSIFRDQLMNVVRNDDNDVCIDDLLEVEGSNLFKMYSNGAAMVELLNMLESSSSSHPHLALQVFNWRRRKENNSRPMSSEEYAKGIKLAGRMKNVDLAYEIFMEATTKRIKNTSTYNALMGAYMYNGLIENCQSVYRDLKRDINCFPTSATFNMLISCFGRRVLVDKMETAFQEMKDYNITPDLTTYNNLIAGYLTAWMWDSMENIYHTMETGPVHPDLNTRLLMLRGYAHSGNLEKMEEIYNMVGSHIREKNTALIRAMICAYSKSPYANRVKRIKELMRLIPDNEYRPWLNVILIKVYADEGLVDQMESSIEEAFDHNTRVNTVQTMRAITTAYFRENAVDQLAKFVTRAGNSGWKVCRSLYHGLLMMLSSQKRFEEMEQVLDEMKRFNFGCSKRTFVILHRAFLEEQQEGHRHKLFRLLASICKHGYGVPLS
uniref:pentatricopeptide repeat-containing protein At2g30780 n=1 Tax=Erigeron canadensis TaxID=72917 RepID=UPI001CB8BF6A|nr:pentatricopeptide repeat-containing protein At2g30780 [Erigeron canadensis]